MQAKANGLPLQDYNWQSGNSTNYRTTNGHYNSNRSSSPSHELMTDVGTVSFFVINLKGALLNFFRSLQIPDVVSEAANMGLRHPMEDFMDDEHPVNGDPMLSHNLLSAPHSPSSSSHSSNHNNSSNPSNTSFNNHSSSSHHHPHHHSLHSVHTSHTLDLNNTDPLLSSSHQHNVDISHCIDPLLANHLLGSPAAHRGTAHDVLQSDNDSLVSDMDIVAWPWLCCTTIRCCRVLTLGEEKKCALNIFLCYYRRCLL